MAIESAGYGAGGGVAGVFLSWLLFRDKVNKMDKDMDTLKDRVIYKDTYEVCATNNSTNFERIEGKLDMIINHMIPKQ